MNEYDFSIACSDGKAQTGGILRPLAENFVFGL
jgi:hypothetical protein